MPTSHCRFPEHHSGPSALPVFAWLAAIAIGALVVTHWHEVVLALVVVAVLVALAVPVFLLWHNHGRGYDPELEHQAAAEHARQLASAEHARPLPARAPTAIDAPAVHHHLHLHGLSADDMAGVARQAIAPPRDAPW